MIKYVWKNLFDFRIKAIFVFQFLLLSLCSLISVYPVILIKKVVDLAVYGKTENINIILSVGIFYLSVQVARAILVAMSKYLSKYMQVKLSFNLQKNILEHIGKVKLENIKFSDSSQMSNTLLQDTQYISENIVEPFTEFISAVFTFGFGFYFISTINFYLALLVLPLGLISSITIKMVSKKSNKNISTQRETTALLWKSFSEGILGFIPLRFHGFINEYFKKVNSQGELLKNTSINQGKIESLSYFATSSLFMVTIGTIMIDSSVFVVQGSMTLGGLTAIMMYSHMLSDPLIQLQEINHKIQRLKVSLYRVLKIMDLPFEDEPQACENINEIELVNAEYVIDDHKILDNINLHINKGSSLIISGATGSGKTTLVNLMTGIYEGKPEMVIYKNDGKTINGKPNISYMLQDEYIFDDTIINNILIGNRNLTQVELDKIIEVCELGNIVGNHIGAIGDTD